MADPTATKDIVNDVDRIVDEIIRAFDASEVTTIQTGSFSTSHVRNMATALATQRGGKVKSRVVTRGSELEIEFVPGDDPEDPTIPDNSDQTATNEEASADS